jgi:hypothetical protein
MHISFHIPPSTFHEKASPKQGEPEGVFHKCPLTPSHIKPEALRLIT